MDPATVIVTAIALGAAAGLKPTAEQPIKDAYAGLKGLLVARFGKRGDTAKAVESVEQKPDSNGRKETLKEELVAAGAHRAIFGDLCRGIGWRHCHVRPKGSRSAKLEGERQDGRLISLLPSWLACPNAWGC